MNLKPAFLVLSDGTCFEGIGFGFKGQALGEVVFNTGITGYQEVLTDPSYFGQIITFTYPELGNTGVNSYDEESGSPSAKGVIVRQFLQEPSNWRATQSFEEWLKSKKIVGICGLDTRALVRHLRESGPMNGIICSDSDSDSDFDQKQLLKIVREAPLMEGLNLADEVSTKSSYKWNSLCDVGFDQRKKSNAKTPFRVAALDFGIKKSILTRLVAYGCEIEVLPSSSSLKDVLKLNPDGIFLSNGPGDPAAVTGGISLAKQLIETTDLPIFGICLGHQILGLAMGANTFKLPYGHRGLNHPCSSNEKLEITSQNHGFAIDPDSLDNTAVEITYFNLNDQTIAGIALKNRPIFGVQYHPEASPGPHDADHHFEHFVFLMQERRMKVV